MVRITHREEIAAQFAFPSDTQVVILDIWGFVCQHSPPIRVGSVFISVQGITVHQVGCRIPVRIHLQHIVPRTAFFQIAVCYFAQETVAVFRIHIFVGRFLVRKRAAVLDCRFAHRFTLLRGDQDHTVTGFRTVDGGCACIFQDIDGFDIVHIDIDHVATEDNTVQNDQRAVTTTDGRASANGHVRIFTGFGHGTHV